VLAIKVYLMYGKTPSNVREQRLAEFDETDIRLCSYPKPLLVALGLTFQLLLSQFSILPESLVTTTNALNRISKWKDKELSHTTT
jgi:hypothetical protein